jgi:hypothetical protein
VGLGREDQLPGYRSIDDPALTHRPAPSQSAAFPSNSSPFIGRQQQTIAGQSATQPKGYANTARQFECRRPSGPATPSSSGGGRKLPFPLSLDCAHSIRKPDTEKPAARAQISHLTAIVRYIAKSLQNLTERWHSVAARYMMSVRRKPIGIHI